MAHSVVSVRVRELYDCWLTHGLLCGVDVCVGVPSCVGSLVAPSVM